MSEKFSESHVKLVQDYRGTSEHPFSLDAPNIRSPHEHILEPIQLFSIMCEISLPRS